MKSPFIYTFLLFFSPLFFALNIYVHDTCVRTVRWFMCKKNTDTIIFVRPSNISGMFDSILFRHVREACLVFSAYATNYNHTVDSRYKTDSKIFH